VEGISDLTFYGVDRIHVVSLTFGFLILSMLLHVDFGYLVAESN
jgi:hypothetical protein